MCNFLYKFISNRIFLRKVLLFLISLFFSFNNYANMIDPTQPSSYDASQIGNAAENTFQLNTVMMFGGKLIAVINGDVFQRSDIINGYKLTGISPDSVVLSSLSKQDSQLILTLETLEVKKFPVSEINLH